MPHSYANCLFHCVSSTKERRKIITPDLRDRLYPYMGGIARENDMKSFAIGGTDDHVHLLLSIPATLAVAKAIQLIKGGSSKWIHDTFPNRAVLSGRRATVHSASASPTSRKPWPTSSGRNNTTRGQPFKTSSGRF